MNFNTFITETDWSRFESILSNIDKFFKYKKVDGELMVTNATIKKTDLINKISNIDIQKGQGISNNNFISLFSFRKA